MIQPFDFSAKGWVSGTGLRAILDKISFETKHWQPQYLMQKSDWFTSSRYTQFLKIGYREVARTTDTRSFIGAVLPSMPSGHKVPILQVLNPKDSSILYVMSTMNSFVFDWMVRVKLGGTALAWFVLEELALPKNSNINLKVSLYAARLNLAHIHFAPKWLIFRDSFLEKADKSWYQLWAITSYERLRLRCILDAIVAELYGLEIDDFAWILRDCDYPITQVCDKKFARTLEPKGFWRVDKEKDPELRHTVLSLVAFHDLKRLGLETFLNLNDGEGWMLPETLRLADYNLGQDDRAKHPQPVASRLGERFLPWQLQGTPEDSWQECERQAENLKRL